ncbi:thioredoxin family protein [Rhodococcus triatomae]|nr:putative thioredoxin [Rhodococcus triatomae BKS 15-14]
MTGLVVLTVALVATVAVAVLIRSRSGKVRATTTAPAADARRTLLGEVGIPAAGPAIVHFSADWCGPCAAVRRVVAGTLATLDDRLPRDADRPVDIELDIDENPALARELGVLSLPTTFVFDRAGEQRFRVSGVPTASDLEQALVPLCRPEGSHPEETR